jgi:replicative superfamily II helicase
MSFITISKDQFEAWLNLDAPFVIADEPNSKEIIYDIPLDNSKINLRIYSSIDISSNVTREIGSDAIRCVLFDTTSNKPIDKAKRTHRMENWKERLTDKIINLKAEFRTLKFCPSCGSAMALREGTNGNFYGCLAYPNCKTTLNMNGSFAVKKAVEQPTTISIPHCPECDAPMAKRSGRRGEFYGCTNFFKTGCKGTRQVEEVEVYGIDVEEQEVPKQSDDFNFDSLFRHQEEEVSETPKQEEPKKPEKQIELISTSAYPHLTFKFDKFNPVQSEVFQYYDKDVNCIVAAATSAGKTTIAEMFMADSIVKGKKAIFLSPLKAVSQEKYDDWTDQTHTWGKLNVSIVTGDYQLTEKRVEELNNANVILMTTEMMDSRTRRIAIEKNNWLLEASTVVMDESHLLCMKGRGDRAESAIMRFTKQNPSCRIVFLSATMPNVDELARWLTSLNGKKTELVNSEYRPCQLDIHYEPYDDYGRYAQVESNKIRRALEITQQYKDDKFIIFVHAKKTGRDIARMLEQECNEKVEVHNAELSLQDRIRVSKSFKEKDGLRIIVATSTLAWGINLPARRVIITGVHRGMSEVEPLDIKQECGRAGRVGFDPKGDAHILLPQSKLTRYKTWCQNIPPILSTMNDQEILAFHIVSEISEGEVYNIETLMSWYNRSLAAFQSNFLDRVDAEALVNKLEKMKIIEKQGNRYKITKLGKIASLLYYSPYSIAGWYFNFNKIFMENNVSDISMSWALSNISDNNNNFIGRDMKDSVTSYINSCRRLGLDISEACASVGIMFYSCLIYADDVEEYKKRSVKFDMERVTSALQMIDNMHAHWNKDSFWEKLQLRVVYEVTEEQTEICSLKGIGGERTRLLFGEGIRTKADLVRKSQLASDVLGYNVYQKILKDNDLY